MKYEFDDFCLSDTQRRLYRNGEVIAIGTRAYHLLLALLAQPDQVVTREQLTEQAWPGQVVTAAALTKQVTRLRALLDTSGSRIQTERGVGFLFTGPVMMSEEMSSAAPVASSRQSPRVFTWTALVVATCVAGLIGWYRLHNVAQEPIPVELASGSSSPASAVPATIERDITGQVPASAPIAPNWLQLTGIPLIVSLINDDSNLQAIAAGAHLIEITGADKTLYRLDIQLTEVAAMHRAVLRMSRASTSDAAMAADEADAVLERETLSTLLSGVTNWVRQNAGASALQPAPGTLTDDYVLRSYLMGQYERGRGRLEVAQHYLRIVWEKAPHWYPGAKALAQCYAAQGQSEKAVALVNLLMDRDQSRLSDLQQAELLFIKLGVATSLSDVESMNSLGDSISGLTSGSGKAAEKILLFQSQARMAIARLNWTAAEAFNDEAIALAQSTFPRSRQLANLYAVQAATYNLARAEGKGQLERQIYRAKQALALFREQGDVNGLLGAYGSLIGAYFYIDDIDAAMASYDEARQWLTDDEPHVNFIRFDYSSAPALAAAGRLKEFEQAVSRINAIGERVQFPLAWLNADLVKIHAFQQRGQYAQAERLATTVIDTVRGNSRFPLRLIAQVKEVQAFCAARAQPLERAESLLSAYRDAFPQYAKQPLGEFGRAEAFVLARNGQWNAALDRLARAREHEIARSGFFVANMITYEMLQLLLECPEATCERWQSSTLFADIERRISYSYWLNRLRARYAQRDGHCDLALQNLDEIKQRTPQLWRADDQLLYEQCERDSAISKLTGGINE